MIRPTSLAPRLQGTGRPSLTAEGVTFLRAAEHARPAAQRIVSDPYAATFLSAPSRALLAAARVGAPLRRPLDRLPVGGAATVLCRHRFIDEQLLAALPGIEQVLVLGAGYDSRAYRFAGRLESRPVYEVDLAPLSRRKASVVDAHRELFGPPRVRRVEIDFRVDSLRERLGVAGFTPGAPTMIVWEGVVLYLDRLAVETTLDDLSALCGPGSVLALDCWRHVSGPGPMVVLQARLHRAGERALALLGEPVTFTAEPDEATALLAAHGWEVCDLARGAELTARYATAGRRSDDGMFLLAATSR